jgi:Fe-S oxidoreductase
MGHLTPGVKQAMQQIFKNAGVNYNFIDKDGSICCGRPLKLAGLNQAALTLINENTRKLLETEARVLVTSCPICYKIFNTEYNLGAMQIMHHSVYIEKLVNEGRISLQTSAARIVFHDPCELGRASGIYKEPRNLLRKMAEVVDVSEEKENSLCCGGSIGDVAMDFNQRNVIRDSALKILCEQKPDMLVTACPLCKKTFNSGSSIIVKDIAEMVAENLNSPENQIKRDELVEALY